jgi:multidrug efflux system outer membrane protein
VIQQAFREVGDALANQRETAEIRAAGEVRVTAARDYLRLARLQYTNGVLAYLDVLDAERQLFDAELELSDATNRQLTSVVDLYRALGGGWSTPNSRTSVTPPATCGTGSPDSSAGTQQTATRP